MDFINIGYGNLISKDKVVTIVGPDAAPIKRLIAESRANGRVIDASQGKATKSVILTTSDHLVLSALTPIQIAERTNNENGDEH